ncbi:MAG: CheR family methyltransferase, partial [Bacteroidota bacterium]
DVVFCRNLLIYFDKPTQEMVVQRLCQNLRPGGYLMLGHSDSITGFACPLVALGHSIFRRE